MVAAQIEIARPARGEACAGGLLGIEPAELEPVGGDVGDHGQKMRFFHGMRHGDQPFVVDVFDHRLMELVRLLCLHRRQRDAAAGDHARSGGMEQIAADRAAIEDAAQQVSGAVAVGDAFAGEKLPSKTTTSPEAANAPAATQAASTAIVFFTSNISPVSFPLERNDNKIHLPRQSAPTCGANQNRTITPVLRIKLEKSTLALARPRLISASSTHS